MKHLPNNFKTYLFDVDGTLIDTAELIYQSFKFSCKKFANIDIDREKVMAHIGLPFKPQLDLYIGEHSDEEVEEIFSEHIAYQKEIAPKYLKLFPVVKETIQKLIESNKKVAIVTSRKRSTLIPYLTATGINSLFDSIVTPEDTELHKPHPEPIIKALQLLDSSQESAIYIGDSVFDIEAGHRAGIKTAFVSWSNIHHSQCHISPDFVIESMNELLPL